MTPKKDEKGKNHDEKLEKGPKEKNKKVKGKLGEEEYITPDQEISPQSYGSDGTTLQFITPNATQIIPFYYEQRPLDLQLPASFFQQKIQEYGLSKADIYIPSDEIPKELRRFKALPPESQRFLEQLLVDKPTPIKKRVLVILQYLHMVAEFSK